MTSEEVTASMVRRDYEQIVLRLGCEGITDNCSDRKKDELLTRSLGLAALRLGDLRTALASLERLVSENTPPSSRDFCELAALHWLQEEPNRAIASLQQASNCSYGDSSGNMTPALILYYIAVKLQRSDLKNQAKNEVLSKLNTGLAKNWPGPLGRYLVEDTDEPSVEELLADVHVVRQPDERCRFDFYRAVKSLEDQNLLLARGRFLAAIQHSMQRTWSTEFVLAKHEANRFIPHRAT